MQTEETTIDPYQKGFNEGYLITKHLPELSDSLSTIKNETPRIDGFKDGRRQFVLDQAREHSPAWMKDRPTKEQGQDKTKGRDIEPEH